MLATYAPLLGVLAALLGYARLNAQGELAKSIRSISNREVVAVAVIAGLSSLALAAMHAWPWTWQWPPYNPLRIEEALVQGRQFTGLATWCVATILVIPILEEIIFRFGILRLTWKLTRSATAAVCVSSVAFAAAHLGGTTRPDAAHTTNAVWLFIASMVIGALTVRRRGSLVLAIAAHMARNAVEVLMLIGAASSQ